LKLGGEILVFGGASVALWDAGAPVLADTALLYVRDA